MSYYQRLSVWLSVTLLYAGCFGLAYCLLPEFWRNLQYYCFYMSLANSLIPLAVNPPTVAAGIIYHPILVGFLGALATSYANSSEFLLLGPVLGHKKLAPVRNTRAYQKILRLLHTWPRLLVYSASLLPIPVDIVRFTALASGFSARRYLTFDWLGRFTRYTLLAWLGNVFQDSYIVLGFIIFFFLMLPFFFSWKYKMDQSKPYIGLSES